MEEEEGEHQKKKQSMEGEKQEEFNAMFESTLKNVARFARNDAASEISRSKPDVLKSLSEYERAKKITDRAHEIYSSMLLWPHR